MATADVTATSSSVEPTGDGAGDIEPVAAHIMPPVLEGNLADTIGDMLVENTTMADGTVIPKRVRVNTACIIFADFTATFIAYAVITNIDIFGEQFLRYDREDVEKTSLIVTGVDAALFLLTGCLTYWYGYYYTAMHIYSIISLVGTCILPLLTFDWSIFGPSYVISIPIRRIFFYMARVIIGLGVAGINATAPPLAARQIQKYGDASVQSCFHYIFMAIRCAPLLAYTSLSFVQLNVSFFCGYLSTVAFKLLSMSTLIYLRKGFPRETSKKLKASSVQVTDEENIQLLGEGALKSTSTTAMALSTSSVDPSAGSASVDTPTTNDPATTAATYGTVTVEEASVAATSVETLPETARHALWVCCAILLFSCLVPFSIVRYQISSSYISQAQRMKPVVLGKTVSPDLLHQYLPLLGIALAPVFDVYVYPYIIKTFITLSMPNRIKIGIACATMSVLSAAIIETARMAFIQRGDSFIQEINNQSVVASNLTLGALIPQYVFMGAADVFIYTTSLEFAFRQSPRTMQAIVTGIFYSYEAIGRIVAILFVPLINTITRADPWYPHEINDGQLDYYFLVLTAISLVNLVIFCLMESGYERVDHYLWSEDRIDGATGGSITVATTTMIADSTTTSFIRKPPPMHTQPVIAMTPSAQDC